MKQLTHITLAVLLFAAAACAQPTSPQESVDDPATASSMQVQTKRIGKLFEKVLPTLEKTRKLVDRHETLPPRTYIPFAEDQNTNQSQIDKLLDKAIEMLELSEVSEYRQKIRGLQAAIKESGATISQYRRKKISSPRKKELTSLERANPFLKTYESYEKSIQKEQAKIKELEAEQIGLKREFKESLNKIGLTVSDEEVDSLLTSISGDDLVSMIVVFDNVKNLTTQLQKLTDESEEDVDVAKRYYGMYLVMVQVMDRLQKTFVDEITNSHIPKLKEYAEKAQQNITEATNLIETSGGDIEVLQQNIRSNDVTYSAAQVYIQHLREQAQTVSDENQQTLKNLATAENTYKTVKLSSMVAILMKDARQKFDSLMRLKVPPIRDFDNAAIRQELQRMTDELRSN